MTVSEWNDLDVRGVVWEIYKTPFEIRNKWQQEAYEKYGPEHPKELQDAYNEIDKKIELDLSIIVPDGVYDAIYGYEDNQQRRSGIIVKDFQFVPEPTAECIYQMVWRTEGRFKVRSDMVPRIRKLEKAGDFEKADEIRRQNMHIVPSKEGDPISHKYVERMEYLPDENAFRVTTGS